MTSSPLSVFAAARDAPNRDALVFEHRVWSWATLAAEVETRRDTLQATGVRAGERVAVRAHNSPEAVTTEGTSPGAPVI